jgi:hypothetical protein
MRARNNSPRPRPALVSWATRAGVLLGGVALLNLLRPVQPGIAESDPTEAMGRGQPATPPSYRARQAGHETRDLGGRTLTLLVAGLGATVACVIGLMVVLMGFFVHARNAAAPHYTAQQTAVIVPPAPNLQAAPLADIAQLHEREEKLLEHYAWIDSNHTRARVPIERAMALIVGRSLDAAP